MLSNVHLYYSYIIFVYQSLLCRLSPIQMKQLRILLWYLRYMNALTDAIGSIHYILQTSHYRMFGDLHISQCTYVLMRFLNAELYDYFINALLAYKKHTYPISPSLIDLFSWPLHVIYAILLINYGFSQKDGESSQHRTTPSIARESFIQSFSKKLTPSDTSTHGGLSVPRKCANECFPPLVSLL